MKIDDLLGVPPHFRKPLYQNIVSQYLMISNDNHHLLDVHPP